MKNKKRKYILLIVIVILFIGVITIYNNYNNDIFVEKDNNLSNSGLSLMVETKVGSGEYTISTSDEWPTKGYEFNAEKSACENGGTLSWDEENQSVVMTSKSSDKCYAYFDKYNPITINNYSITSNGNSIAITIDATAGTGTIAKYLYSKDNGVSYVQSANNTYTFTGLDKGTYNIKEYEQDSNANNSEIISKTIEITSITLADYVKSLYTGTQGGNSIYYHNGTIETDAGDNSYRYAGANPNNFVCFGSNASTCPTDNLYRIIGVFGDKVKLIKYDYANSNLLGTDGDYGTATYSKSDSETYEGELTTINRYYWNYENDTSINYGEGSNEWSTSLFNKTNLNTNYLNKIGTTWSNLIEDTTWKVSGHTKWGVTPKTMYTAEITNATKTYGPSDGVSKIGLMYASDYGFAAAPSAWTGDIDSYYNSSVTSVNWMYMGLLEWTMTPSSLGSISVFCVSSGGDLVDNLAFHVFGARPVFYLKASVAYAGGSGTNASPITLVV